MYRFDELLTGSGTTVEISSIALRNEKVAYTLNYIRDLREEPLTYAFFGAGPGTYSSRAAMQLAGSLGSLDVNSTYPQYEQNTGYLWGIFSEKEQWQKGAFYWPYNQAISIFAELGLLVALVFFFMLAKRIFAIRSLSRADKWFLFMFIFSVCFVDHYLEYANAIFVVIFFLLTFESIKSKEQGWRPA
jgi:hypothetical protein